MRRHRLRVLNLDDNLISSISELQSLAALSNLRELTLRSKQTDNPICRKPKYGKVVLGLIPSLEMFDGVPVTRRVPVKENEEPNVNENMNEVKRDVQEELKQILKGVIVDNNTRLKIR